MCLTPFEINVVTVWIVVWSLSVFLRTCKCFNSVGTLSNAYVCTIVVLQVFSREGNVPKIIIAVSSGCHTYFNVVIM